MTASPAFTSTRELRNGIVDPAELTRAQLAALRLANETVLYRRPGGWRGVGTAKVTLRLAGELSSRGLVRGSIRNGKHTLMLTYAGLNTLAVADQRAERRGRS